MEDYGVRVCPSCLDSSCTVTLLPVHIHDKVDHVFAYEGSREIRQCGLQLECEGGRIKAVLAYGNPREAALREDVLEQHDAVIVSGSLTIP